MAKARKDQWEEIDPERLIAYTLPEGVTQQCSVKCDESDLYCTLYIGTNRGVYRARLRVELFGEKVPHPVIAKLCGLQEFCIEKIVYVRQCLRVLTVDGKAFEIREHRLSGVR